MGRSTGATGAKGAKGASRAKGASGAKGTGEAKRPAGARPSRAPGRARASVAAAPPAPTDQALTDTDQGARIRARRRGGLGDLGKLAWQKNLPELSLLDERRRLDDPAPAQALPPSKDPAAPAPRGDRDLPLGQGPLQGSIPPEALALLKEELSAILALCQE